jgi:hypothetical protein
MHENKFLITCRQVVLATWVDDDGRLRFLVVKGQSRASAALRSGRYMSIHCDSEEHAMETRKLYGDEATILPFEPIGAAADRVVAKLRGRS